MGREGKTNNFATFHLLNKGTHTAVGFIHVESMDCQLQRGLALVLALDHLVPSRVYSYCNWKKKHLI